MKAITVLIISLLILSSSRCEKEGEDCHYSITVKNNSDIDIIFAFPGYYNSKCMLTRRAPVITSYQQNKYTSRSCWENILLNGRTQDVYFVDPNNFNTSEDGFYDCDSIPNKNTILKHIVLTLDELKANNFTITYP